MFFFAFSPSLSQNFCFLAIKLLFFWIGGGGGFRLHLINNNQTQIFYRPSIIIFIRRYSNLETLAKLETWKKMLSVRVNLAVQIREKKKPITYLPNQFSLFRSKKKLNSHFPSVQFTWIIFEFEMLWPHIFLPDKMV